LDFAKVLSELARFLDAQGVRWGIAGGIALNAHGHARGTTDLDLVVEESVKPDLLRHVAGLGYELLRVSEGFSNHLHPAQEWGRVDFIYLDPRTAGLLFGDARLARPLGGLEVLVPSPKHLIAMKVQAIRNRPSRMFQDMADIRFLARLPGVDLKEVRGYFEKHGLADKFVELERTLGDD
jgi:hypothetical protein